MLSHYKILTDFPLLQYLMQAPRQVVPNQRKLPNLHLHLRPRLPQSNLKTQFLVSLAIYSRDFFDEVQGISRRIQVAWQVHL